MEAGITSIVHEEVSPYQKIQILDTIDFGRFVLYNVRTEKNKTFLHTTALNIKAMQNVAQKSFIIPIKTNFSVYCRVLLLDGAVQLSEADDVYTSSLLADSQYQHADVLILGGGDGALLANLLHHHQPRQVTMVEL